MKFQYFEFENFKGIEHQRLDLTKNIDSNIFALVGLNESGKTTILEAINYFAYKPEKLDALELQNYEVSDVHNLIPINKRDNFNGKISIKAGIELEDFEIVEVKKELSKKGHNIRHFDKNFTFTQEYFFENSNHISEKNKQLWTYDIKERKKNAKKDKKLDNEKALFVASYIKDNLPSILYFPNFLFEFPEKIYLDPETSDKKHQFYQRIIQDILDSLENDTNIAQHLIKRILSNDPTDKRNLASLIGKMQKKLTNVIFEKWNLIFNREISKTEVILNFDKDDNGAYLEFNIKDDVDTYRIIERSLGFRWFFVYILLTQFREYRKGNKNAIFLFDEPASNLHPSAQTELLKSFEKLPKVIYTTHSHYLINPKWLESTFVIKNEAIDYDNEEIFNTRNTKISIYRYRDFAVNYPNQSSYYQPILEVINYKPSNIELVPNVIITEGKNDFYTLMYIQETILNKKKSLKVIPGTSASNMETLISLYVGWGQQFYVLLDSDNEGKTQKKRYINVFGSSIKKNIYTLADLKEGWDNSKTEDLFLDDDKIKIINTIYPNESFNLKKSKKILNQCIQELYMKKEKIDLSLESRDNFSLIIDKFEKLF